MYIFFAFLRSTTNAQGQTVIQTIQSTSTTASSNPASVNHSSNSHVAAIAGGAVGGAAALLLLLLLGWFIASRRRRSDFDGDFDPDNVGSFRRGRQSLVPEGPTGAEVTPYTLHNGPANGTPHMGEYNATGMGAAAGLGAGVLAGTAMHHSRTPSNHRSASSQSEYPQTESSYMPNPYGSHYGQNPHDLSAVAPLPGSASERSHPSSSQPRSAKEREAYAQRFGTSGNPAYASGSGGALRLATGSPVDDDASSNVVVHQDGGRIRPEHQSPNEIPPTYDSLPPDERS